MRLRLAVPAFLLAAGACVTGEPAAPTEPDFNLTATVVVNRVILTPAAATIANIGGTAQLTATLRDQNGMTLPPGSVTVRWSTLNPKRVAVSPTGLVTSLAATGQARVIAAAGTKADTTVITLASSSPVNAPSGISSSVTVTPTTIVQGSGSALIRVVVRDGGGAPIRGASVTINASGTGNIVAVPPPTDSNGVTTAAFSSTKPETKTISVAANGVTLASSATVKVLASLEAVASVMSCAIPAVPPAGTVNLATDVTYAAPGGVPQKLDVAWPRTTGLHPVVVVVHGGGWTQGDKSTFRNAILQLASQGYTAIAVNYRLVSGSAHVFPAAMQDLRCALRWIRANATKYRLDPARGGAIGVSAGAHLAQLLGLAPEATRLDGTCPVGGAMTTINAVVSFEGPSDLRQSSLFTSVSLPAITALLGGAPESVPNLAATASPITYPSAGDPPVFLVHGTADGTVPVVHSSMMKSAVNLAGVPATFMPVQGVGHQLQLFSTSPAQVPATCTMLEFLKLRLQP